MIFHLDSATINLNKTDSVLYIKKKLKVLNELLEYAEKYKADNIDIIKSSIIHFKNKLRKV